MPSESNKEAKLATSAMMRLEKLLDMTEGDILDVLATASDAIGLPDPWARFA